jgi:hypothetical protein
MQNMINSKHEILNPKQIQSTNDRNSKRSVPWILVIWYCLEFRA